MNAIGMLELSSIAAGFETGDAMIKSASVKLLECMPVCPGKFIVLVGGAVADVKSSVEAGSSTGGVYLIDSMVIPNVHPQVFKAVNAVGKIEKIDALGIIETFTVASAIIAADYAVKAADVELIEIRLSRGQGGKSYITLTGSVSAVEASVNAGADTARTNGALVKSVVIPSPHRDMHEFIY